MSHNTISITDYSQENSSFSFESAALNAGNIAAQIGLLDDLRAATINMSIGHVSKQQVAQILLDNFDVPGSVYAQREMKWLVTYQAVTSGKKYQLEIPAPDLTANLVPGTDNADLESTDWVAWIAAFVAVAKAPDDITDSVIVLGAKLVGRNL